jgi:hypothetical protein
VIVADASVLTAIGQAVVALVVALIGLLVRRKVQQVHVLVNNRSDEQDRKIAALEAALLEARRSPADAPTAEA